MNYEPEAGKGPVVKPGEFNVAAIGLEHGHIYGMCHGLVEAGATLTWVYDSDEEKVKQFLKAFPYAKPASSEEEILSDPRVQLVCTATVTSERCALGLRVMAAGKDYFSDKAPATTLEQVKQARNMAAKTGRKYMVYYSERIHSEAAVYAGQLIERGAIGRVVQVIGMGPHRLGDPKSRPGWFFEPDKYGGILCDIGSHQIEQFLFYAGVKNATLVKSQVANYNHKQFPGFYDFGDCTLVGDNGAAMYFRVDWLTPDGLGTWGDGRTFILGTNGYIELRKYINVGAKDGTDNHVFLVDKEGEHHFEAAGKVGYPYFGQLILDCINRTEYAMTQEHAFLAAELCVRAQQEAAVLEG